MRFQRAIGASAGRDPVWWFARRWHPALKKSDLNAAASIERQGSTAWRAHSRGLGTELRAVRHGIDLLTSTNPVESLPRHR
jgi:hypothetical protein